LAAVEEVLPVLLLICVAVMIHVTYPDLGCLDAACLVVVGLVSVPFLVVMAAEIPRRFEFRIDMIDTLSGPFQHDVQYNCYLATRKSKPYKEACSFSLYDAFPFLRSPSICIRHFPPSKILYSKLLHQRHI